MALKCRCFGLGVYKSGGDTKQAVLDALRRATAILIRRRCIKMKPRLLRRLKRAAYQGRNFYYDKAVER